MQRLARRWRASGNRIGFVPTMGCLHEGHLSLIREARRRVGRKAIVVVSIYVNPTQFGPGEDLAKYPRNPNRDRYLCREAGVDALFLPSDEAMYPNQAGSEFSTFVTEERLSRGMESGTRPTHFRGVTTIVAKLFNVVLPDIAVFGAKDYQQAAVVGRMTRDLNFPVRVIVSPTVREPDGLALSSRNRYLDDERRKQATVLWRAIECARGAVARRPSGVPTAGLKRQIARLIEAEPDARLDYLAFFDSTTLEPVQRANPNTRLALAVYIGSTRLIDNAALCPQAI